MHEYMIWQWIVFFYIYCFLGWCIESTIVSVSRRKIINRGFLTGPFLPIYGFGALSILLVTIPVRGNYVLVYILGVVAATILEYVAGTVMELLFRVKYWDYSYKKIQFQGKVCLQSSLFWGILALLLTETVHSLIEEIVLGMPDVTLKYIVIAIGLIMSIDVGISARAAFDLKHTLEKLAFVKIEIEKLQVQLSKAKDSASEQLNKLKDGVVEKTMEETVNFKERLKKLQLEKDGITFKMRGFLNRLYKSYPNAKSNRFNDVFKELKERIKKK